MHAHAGGCLHYEWPTTVHIRDVPSRTYSPDTHTHTQDHRSYNHI